MLDLVYPRRCSICAQPNGEGEEALCWDCRSRLLRVEPPFCQQCGAPSAGAMDHAYRCHDCSTRSIYFDQARAALIYDGPTRDLVCGLKYRSAIWLLPEFHHWLRACFSTYFSSLGIDAACWIPLHWFRRRARGMNQSERLAQAFADGTAGFRPENLLRKTRYTRSQTRLTASQRLTNVTGSIRLRKPEMCRGRRVLVIDDVMTTGSTVNEAARRLKEAGAEKVYVITLARGGL